MYELNDRPFIKKFIDILKYAMDKDYIKITDKNVKIEVFNDIRINGVEIPYTDFTDLTLDDLASIETRFSYSPTSMNKILEIKINTTI